MRGNPKADYAQQAKMVKLLDAGVMFITKDMTRGAEVPGQIVTVVDEIKAEALDGDKLLVHIRVETVEKTILYNGRYFAW